MTATNPPATGYVFADDPARGATHHHVLTKILAAMLDDFTIWRLRPYVKGSYRCLEVAAGAGSIATWMAEQGATVLATDTNPQQIPTGLPNLTVIAHDITTGPLEGSFDAIHARLLLGHLHERHQVVATLAGMLGPGGVLVIEEFQAAWDWCLLEAPAGKEQQAQRLLATYHQALTTVLTGAGNDPTWGRHAYRSMRAHGLTHVDTQWWAKSWYGGQPGCRLAYTAAEQLRPKLVAAGMSSPDVDAFRELLMDPQLMIHANLAVSTIGTRAA